MQARTPRRPARLERRLEHGQVTWLLITDDDLEHGFLDFELEVLAAYDSGDLARWTTVPGCAAAEHGASPGPAAGLRAEYADGAVILLRGDEEVVRVAAPACTYCAAHVPAPHANGWCAWCAAEIGTCCQRGCPHCYPLSFRTPDAPVRTWSVVLELTWGNGTVRADHIDAVNEAEALDEACHLLLDDYEPDRAASLIRSSHVFPTV